MSGEAPLESHDALIACCEKVLGVAWNGAVTLALAERISDAQRRNLLLRLAVLRAPNGHPATVILKQGRAWAFADGLLNDWCGSEFLGGLRGHPPFAPSFIAGDRDQRFVLLEDLGKGSSLVEVLLGDDRDAAQRALTSHAAGLGAMHAAAMPHAARYQARRAALGPVAGTSAETESRDWRSSLDQLLPVFAAIGIKPATGFVDDVAMVVAAIAEPGPFLTYTHGDPCPDNCVRVDGGLRLIDFECGGLRHALLDGVYGRMSFPTCWCANRIPEGVLEAMERAYRDRLTAGCAAAGDDTLFRRAMLDCCAMWMLRSLHQLLEEAITESRTWGISSIRQRLPARIDAFLALCADGDPYPALRETVERVRGALERRWSAEDRILPYYPAFSRAA